MLKYCHGNIFYLIGTIVFPIFCPFSTVPVWTNSTNTLCTFFPKKNIVSNGISFTAPIFCVLVHLNKSCSENMGFDQDASYKSWGIQKNCLNIFFLILKFVANLAIRKTRQNPATRMFKRKLREHCNTATLSYSTPSYSTRLYATHSYSPLASYSQLL